MPREVTFVGGGDGFEKGIVARGFLADGGMECESDAGGAVAGRVRGHAV